MALNRVTIPYELLKQLRRAMENIERHVMPAPAEPPPKAEPPPQAKAAREYVTRNQAAAIVGLTRQYLAVLAMRGEGPPVYKPTGNRALYRLDELYAWIERAKQ